MGNANVGSEAYLYIVFTVLAGIGIENIFIKEKEDVFEPVVNSVSVANPVARVVAEKKVKAEVEVPAEAAIPAPEQKQTVTIQFLENPLPVPKKHTPKTLDYRLQGEDGDQFDLDVSEEDDFDI
jgi:hypothetical protein